MRTELGVNTICPLMTRSTCCLVRVYVEALLKYKQPSFFHSSSKLCTSLVFSCLVSSYFLKSLIRLSSKVFYYSLFVFIELNSVICPRIARICVVAAQNHMLWTLASVRFSCWNLVLTFLILFASPCLQ